MKLFCRKEVQGAISLFLVAVLLPMMVISALMVDTARYNLAKSMVSNAGDLAMNGGLADYDAILKDVYGLFAMSQADDVAKNVRRYFEDSLISYGVVGEEDAGSYVQELLGYLYEYLLVEDRETADFLAMTMEPSDLKVTKVEGSSLAEPTILEKQIVEYMKYRAPVDFGMSFLDALSAFTKVEAQGQVMQAQVDAQSGLEGVSKSNYELYEAIRAYDKNYSQLEPEAVPPDGRHLKNYGHIFKDEYVREYEKLHRLTLAFCVEAHLGKWELPDLNRSDSRFLILNENGDYITESQGILCIAGGLGDSNTAFGQNTADPLNGYINPFLNRQRTNTVNTLKEYGASARITAPMLELENEANWETALQQFEAVDGFYKTRLDEYAGALKQLDEYAKAMAAYMKMADAEIEQLGKQQEQAAQKAVDIQEQRVTLSTERSKAEALLTMARLSSAAQVQSAEEHLENEDRLKELEILAGEEAEAAAAEIADLRMKNQEIEEMLGEERLAQLEGCLITVRSYAENDRGLEKDLSEQSANRSSYQEQKENKEREREEKRTAYQAVLGECRDCVNSFNQDAVNYKAWKKRMQEYIGNRALEIGGEFRGLFVKVMELKGLLDDAEEEFKKAQQDILQYMDQVRKWSEEKNGYVNGQSSQEDSFSQVQAAQIAEAENVFSREEVEKLGAAINKEQERLGVFIDEVNRNFTYMGSRRIVDIVNAQQIADAIEQRGYSRAFDLTHDIDADRLKELGRLTEPLPCCAFMNYLHQTYQERYQLKLDGRLNGDGRPESDLTPAESSAKATYEGVKKSSDIAKGVEADTGSPENYGYTYQNKDKICGEGYPSSYKADNSSMTGGEGDKETNQDGIGGEKSKKADKDGMEANRSTAGSLLSGIGSAIETGRDKLYVMAYLFDNFSYFTMVQDKVREDGKEPGWTKCGKELYEAYIPEDGRSAGPAAYTGSCVPINALNNAVYGAEVEYVLFGRKDPADNVANAKLGIYAVRMLFNSVYAFTSGDIRNQTRAVALMVQAASCGFIPYQVVQVVLQLALAMGESAIDLKNMEAGAKVVIVKTRDTWTLSMEGVRNLAKGVIYSATDKAAEIVGDMAQRKIGQIVDAAAEEVSGLVQNVEKDLTGMANSAAENMLDMVFARIDALVDEAMNQAAERLFYSEDGPQLMEPEELRTRIMGLYRTVLDDLKGKITDFTGELAGQQSDNALLAAACEAGGKLANDALEEIEGDMQRELLKLQDAVSIRGYVYRQIYSVKAKISEKVQGAMSGLISQVSGRLRTEIDKTAGEIKKKAQEMTDEAKENVTKQINDFVDKKLSFGAAGMETGKLSQANGNPAQSSVKASAVTFGYSDYLRLFVFVNLCASDKSGSMIRRIGDLIQLNISSAREGSDLAHRCGEGFSMAEAKTYLSVEADVSLEMMFLRLGILRRQMDAFGEAYGGENRADPGDVMRVHYLGISGY